MRESFRKITRRKRKGEAETLPFTESHRPRANDPEGDEHDHQTRAGTDGHECFEHEASVEVDAVEGADRARRGVGEQLRVE